LHSGAWQAGGAANTGVDKTNVEAIRAAQSDAVPIALPVMDDPPNLTGTSPVFLEESLSLASLNTKL